MNFIITIYVSMKKTWQEKDKKLPFLSGLLRLNIGRRSQKTTALFVLSLPELPAMMVNR
jgi:hypothetical protein